MCFEEICASCGACHFCSDGIDGTCGHCGEGYPLYEEGDCSSTGKHFASMSTKSNFSSFGRGGGFRQNRSGIVRPFLWI